MRFRSSTLGILAGLGLLCRGSRPANAQPPPEVELEYVRGPSAQSCPGDRAMRDELMVHIGRDPVVAVAPTKIVVLVTRPGSEFVGEMERRNRAGQPIWTHAPMRHGDCAQLLEMMALAIAVEIDPLAGPVAPSSAPQPPTALAPLIPIQFPSSQPFPPRDQLASAAPPRAAEPLRFRLGAVGSVFVGATPSPNLGLAVDFGIREAIFSFSLEGRAALPAETEVKDSGRMSASLFAVGFVPCVHYEIFAGCGLAQIGSLRASGMDVDHPADDDALYAAAGVRAALEWPFYRHLAGRLSADLTATLNPQTLRLAGQDAWEAPLVSAAFGAGLISFF